MTGASASWPAVAARPSAAHALHSARPPVASSSAAPATGAITYAPLNAVPKTAWYAGRSGRRRRRPLTPQAPDARQRDDDADLRDQQVAVREVEREEGLDDAAQPVDERGAEERVERAREPPEARSKGRRRHRRKA
jgi:hypothetical protein